MSGTRSATLGVGILLLAPAAAAAASFSAVAGYSRKVAGPAPVVVAPVPTPHPPPPPPPPPPGKKKRVLTYGDDGKPIDGSPTKVDPLLDGIETASPDVDPPRPPKPFKPAVEVGTAEVVGSLDKEVIRRVVKKHTAEVRYCYEKALVLDPSLSGAVSVKFVIAKTGEVSSSSVTTSTLYNPAVESCVATAVRRWVFPAPAGGGIVMVTYPFRFETGGSSASIDPLPAAAGACAKEPPGFSPVKVKATGVSADIEDLVCARRDAFRTCYDTERLARPDLRGATTIAFTIGPKGAVFESRVRASSHGLPALDACFLKVLRTIPFPPAKSDKKERVFTVDVAPPGVIR